MSSCETDAYVLLLSVHDSGSGIRSDHLVAVFDRFWQVEEGDRRGLGLGLDISKSIVEPG